MAAKPKPVDRSKIVSKLVRAMKKEFGGVPKQKPLPVLETMLFSVCLENSTYDAAQEAFDRLKSDFFDWNEIRVSTISELEPVFSNLTEPEYRAMRVRYLLYYVFDHQYSYDFDGIKRKSLELSHKQLGKIKHLTTFARNYLLQFSLHTHVISVDLKMVRVAVWLGLLPQGCDESSGAELLKSLVRKADSAEFFWLLKSLSVSPKSEFIVETNRAAGLEDGDRIDWAVSEGRLADLLSGKAKRQAAAQARKEAAEEEKKQQVAKRQAAAKKSAAKKKAAVKEAAASAKKAAAKRSSAAKKKTGSVKKKTATKAEKTTASKARKKTAAKKTKKKSTRK